MPKSHRAQRLTRVSLANKPFFRHRRKSNREKKRAGDSIPIISFNDLIEMLSVAYMEQEARNKKE